MAKSTVTACFEDVDGSRETTTLGVLIDYKFFKYNDIHWIYRTIRKAVNEVAYSDAELRKRIKKPGDVQILVQSAFTENSIELEFVFAIGPILRHIDADTVYKIIAYGLLAKKLYDYLRKESEDGRFLGRRWNMDRTVLFKRTRHFDSRGVLRKEEEERFEREVGEKEQFELRMRDLERRR